ncbi:MAG: hypothetical protein JKY31_02725 [Rhodobacteraceae bacterium]|nr:hypothetical protein [Paracoccaceae bacterium]
MLKRTGHLIAIWGLCVAISAVWFHNRWSQWPDGDDYILQAMLAIIALPTSFAHTLFHDGAVLRIFGRPLLALLVVYWGVMIGLQVIYIRKGHRKYLLIFAILAMISALRWMYYAVAMSGI